MEWIWKIKKGMNDMRLYQIFAKQRELDKRIMKEKNINKIDARITILALFNEVAELQNEINWKPWKKEKEIEKKNIIEEIADILHFLVQFCQIFDFDSSDLFKAYMDKNKVNHIRQDNNY